MNNLKKLALIASIIALQACKHPLAIEGEGDIVELNGTGRGCTLEQFKAGDIACVENEVTDDYHVNYKAVPRPGWRFVRWEGPCSQKSDFQHCLLNVSKKGVDWWDEHHPDEKFPPSRAVFQPITGETGFLVAGAPVAGVTYETDTQKGVTGLDGSYQYEEGEIVRFTIGATVLGEVRSKEQVTPFDLAGSPVISGQKITWALQNRDVWGAIDSTWEYYDWDWAENADIDPFHNVINLTVLMQSLDHDADPTNGIAIGPGVVSLLNKVKLEVYRRLDRNIFGNRVYVGQDWETFQNDPTFLHLMGQANRKRRFSAPHGIVKPEVAISRLYNSLGVDPGIVGLSELQIVNIDSSSQEQFIYDSNGNFFRHDVSGPLFTGYEVWHYDLDNNLTRHEQHADGFDHHVINTWQYDSDGRVTHAEENFGGNNAGWGPYSFTDYYTYDHDGNLTELINLDNLDGTERIDSYRYDFDDHGNIELYKVSFDDEFRIFQYVYHSNGAPSEYSRMTPRITESWLFDDSNNIVQFVEEDNSGYVFYQNTSYQYSPDGRLIKREVSNGETGSLLKQEIWQYNESNKLTKYEELSCAGFGVGIECTELSANNDMVDQTIETYQYHGNGKLKLRNIETKEFNFEFGLGFGTQQYMYNANGNLIEYTSSDWPRKKSWQYDANGNMTQAEVVVEKGGSLFVDTIESWEYDAKGNLIRYELDESGDRRIDETRTYQYELTGWGHLFSGIKTYGHGAGMPPFQTRTSDTLPVE